MKKAKETDIFNDKPKRETPKTTRTPENIAAVAESVREATSSLRQILHKDHVMTPYKVQLVQELKPIEHPMRFRLAKWACDRLTEEAYFGKKKIVFSDEAHFDFGGYVNK